MTVATTYEHIALDRDNIPLVDGTMVKIVELVVDHRAYGWSPEELHFQHPELTLGQIHSALAYYWDHHESLDDDIEQRLARVDELRRRVVPSPLQARLRRQG